MILTSRTISAPGRGEVVGEVASLTTGESVIKCPSLPKILKDTYATIAVIEHVTSRS